MEQTNAIVELINNQGLSIALIVVILVVALVAGKKLYADFRSDKAKTDEKNEKFIDRIVVTQEKITETMISVDKRLSILEDDVAALKQEEK